MTDYLDEGTDEGTVSTPIEARGTLTKTQVIFAIGQIVAALGGVIAFMGLGEQEWIVRLYRFFQSAPAVPLIGMLGWAISAGWLWIRNKRRAIERAVMAALVSDRIGKLTGPISPAVQAAIDEAVKARHQVPVTKTKGL